MTARSTREHLAIVERYREGLTLEEVGKQFGLSRERVRQIVRDLASEGTRNPRRAADEGYIQKFHRAAAEWVKRRTPVCAVCLGPNYRGHPPNKFVACSSVCSEAWRRIAVRRLLDENERQRHDDDKARRIVAKPERHTKWEISHAKRVLARIAERRGTVSVREGSTTLEMLRRVGREDIIATLRIVPDDEEHRRNAALQRMTRAREMAAEGKANTWRAE